MWCIFCCCLSFRILFPKSETCTCTVYTKKTHSCLSWSKLYISDCLFFFARGSLVELIANDGACMSAWVCHTALIITKTICDCILAILIIQFLADGGMRACSLLLLLLLQLKLWLATYVAITINKMHTSIIWLKWCYQWQWVPLESEIHTHTHTHIGEHSESIPTQCPPIRCWWWWWCGQ